ncbi:MAG: O-antigen ligase family protein [Chloroflexi bacterium]|nr:O-antigen ligase family protein [Chloroflexota bacterium]
MIVPTRRPDWVVDHLSWGSPLVVVLLALLVGGGLGVAVAAGSPVGVAAVALGLIAAWCVTRGVQAGLLGLVAVATLLPYAVIPVRVGVALTFVDALLAAIFLNWLLRHVLTARRLQLTLAGRLLVAYLVTAVLALVLGAAYAMPSGAALRSFLKYEVAICLFIVVVDVVRERATIQRLVQALILGGIAAAALGLAIHSLPREQIVEVLSSLSVLGYPSGPGVLRFLPGPNNTYSDTLRAVGTSIDPNVFGGMLMLSATLMLGQLFAARPVLPRWLLLPGLGLTATAMVFSESRASWLGLAAAGALLATIRDRRLWLLGLPAVGALLALPVGQRMVSRLASGFAAQDRAAALRVDEYRQALKIIADYPVLGVGFGGAPELGTFVGVSSIYLLVGENTGLIGLGIFLLILAVVMVQGLRAALLAPDREDRALAATLLAPVLAGALVGNLDHYFMNPRFPHMVALFWLYVGLLAAATRRAMQPSQESGVICHPECSEPAGAAKNLTRSGRLHVERVVQHRRGLKAPPTILQSLRDAPVAPVPAVPDGRRAATE